MDINKNNEFTLAIFPFENLTEANGLELFCKSFYIDLVTELSRFRQFRIIASESLENNSGIHPDYCIKGSFRFHTGLLRINAQLINSQTNQIAWADRYEGDKESIFSIQEDLLKEIVSTLQQQLNYDLLIHMRKKPAVKLSVYEHWLNGMEELRKGSLEADEKARIHFQNAIDIDPGYSLAYSGMSLTYFNEWSCQLWERWDVCQKGAFEWAKKAIDLDEQNYVAALVLGRVYLYEAEYEFAEHYLRRALRLNPNDTESLIQIASCFVFLGYLKEAEKLYNKVLQLNPLYVSRYHHVGAFIAFEQGQFEKCITLGSTSTTTWVDFPGMLAAAYYSIGDMDNMHRSWQHYLEEFQEKIVKGGEVDPVQALQWIINVSPYKQQTNLMPFWEFISRKTVSISSRVFSKVRPTENQNFFFKENELWQISFEGKTVRMADVKGFHDMVRLLESPEKQFHCAELIGNAVMMSPERVFDEKAKRSYQKKILELQEEIQWSENNNDYERTTSLQQEYDDIVNHLSVSLGMRGKIRKANDPIDKARSAVTWRIRNAIQKIEKTHPSLGKHLSVSIKTGLFCSYNPEKPLKWMLTGTES